ncbi:MAG: MaoC family dehydratase [Pseudomonadota bacterium]
MSDVAEIKASATLRPRGRLYDEFEVGQEIDHHWGRTLTEADAIQFAHLTLSYNPLYFNREYAKAHGHPDLVVCPHLVFNTVLGLTVEDCSEGIAGPFLGVFELHYHQPVYPGDTLTARSVALEKRLSEKDQGKGIITWRSEGANQRGETVISFKRSNLSNFAVARMIREGAI